MTKEDIKKGLECCLNNNCCAGCPYDRSYYGIGCKNKLYSETIDLIDYLYNLIDYGDKYAKQFKDKNSELEKEIEQAKVENNIVLNKIAELTDVCMCIKNTYDIDTNKLIKQSKIDILNKAKKKLDSAPNGWAYTGYIDDLIEEVEND